MERLTRNSKRTGFFLEHLDYWLFVPILLLSMIGLVVLQEVLRQGYGAGTYPGNFIKQMGAVIVGVLLALLIAYIDLPTLRLVGYVVYGVSFLMLIWVKIDNFSLAYWTGADSWINLPIIGSFQPSELSKIGIALVGGTILERIKEGKVGALRGFIHLALVYGMPLLLILKEPDFGTGFVILVMLALSLFVWGLSWQKILILFLAVLFVALPLMWFFYLEPYQRDRILTVPFRGHDPQLSYHTEQAMRSVASGGLTGNRQGHDIYVPVKESDSIFAAISEYLGFIGTTTVMLLSSIFFFQAFKMAMRLNEKSYAAAYATTALAGQMAFHFIENIGMNVGLLPITGIPLPFMSDGGTSMVVNYMALGILLNFSMNESNLSTR